MSGTEDDPMLLAAEYALGALDLADMREAEARMTRDPAFAAEVVFWGDRLGPLTRVVPPVAPPAAVWSRLALATGIGADRTAVTRGGSGLWKAATGFSLAIAASMALFAFLPRPVTPPGEPARFAAALTPLGQPARFLAETRSDGSLSIIDLTAGSPAPGRSYQLWALPEGATAPISLGVYAPGVPVTTPQAARPSAQEQLLVSDEPAGGSPTGAPTGPVLFGGRLVSVNPAATPGR